MPDRVHQCLQRSENVVLAPEGSVLSSRTYVDLGGPNPLPKLLDHTINTNPVNLSRCNGFKATTDVVPHVAFAPNQWCSNARMDRRIKYQTFFMSEMQESS